MAGTVSGTEGQSIWEGGTGGQWREEGTKSRRRLRRARRDADTSADVRAPRQTDGSLHYTPLKLDGSLPRWHNKQLVTKVPMNLCEASPYSIKASAHDW